jgi:mycothiol system anti-sigma-R factor
MDCKRVGETIFLFFDNEMDEEQLTRFQAHVEICGHCAQQLAYTRKLLLIFRRRCTRCRAPVRLRRRILISLPHRRTLSHDA